jgi:hydrogenase/urease accessory protein HupE
MKALLALFWIGITFLGDVVALNGFTVPCVVIAIKMFPLGVGLFWLHTPPQAPLFQGEVWRYSGFFYLQKVGRVLNRRL